MRGCGDADDGPSHVNTGSRGSSGTENCWEPAGQVLGLVDEEAT